MTSVRSFFSLLRGRSGFAAVVQTGFATAMVLGLNVATGVISARFLGAQGRGELSALLLCPQFLSFLFTLGLPASLIVTVKNHPERAADLLGAALTLALLAGMLAVAVGFAIVPHLMTQYGPDTVGAARGLLVFVLLGVISTVLVAGLQARDRFLAFNRVRYWQSAAVLSALIGLAALGMFHPVEGALAYLLPTVPFLLWTVWRVGTDFKPRLVEFGKNSRDLLSYGMRVYGIDAVGTLLTQLDKVILVAVFAPSVFGVYVVVFNLSRLVTTFAFSALPVLLPRTAGQPLAEVVMLTSRALSAATILTVAALAGFVAFGALILPLLYGAQFGGGYWTLVILCCEAALAGGAGILQQPYLVMNKPGTATLFQALGLAVSAPLIYLLAKAFGPEGAACALLAGTATRFWLTHRGYGRLLGVPAPRLVPTWGDCVGLIGRLRTHLP